MTILTAIPRLPIIINGLRPKRSTVNMANTVKDRLITPTIIVWARAALVPMPIFRKISGA